MAETHDDRAGAAGTDLHAPEEADYSRPGGRPPSVLLIGDSISEGYTPLVRDLLKDRASVRRPDANCGATILGLQQIDLWLGEGRWDVIHFNWGLHDLVRRPVKADLTDLASVRPQVPLPEYEKNLGKLVQRLKTTDAELIWGTTTPVPEGCQCRIPGDEVKYNQAALRVMAEENVPVDDLYAVVLPKLSEFQEPQNVHFNAKGYEFLARAVAQAVAGALANLRTGVMIRSGTPPHQD